MKNSTVNKRNGFQLKCIEMGLRSLNEPKHHVIQPYAVREKKYTRVTQQYLVIWDVFVCVCDGGGG